MLQERWPKCTCKAHCLMHESSHPRWTNIHRTKLQSTAPLHPSKRHFNMIYLPVESKHFLRGLEIGVCFLAVPSPRRLQEYRDMLRALIWNPTQISMEANKLIDAVTPLVVTRSEGKIHGVQSAHSVWDKIRFYIAKCLGCWLEDNILDSSSSAFVVKSVGLFWMVQSVLYLIGGVRTLTAYGKDRVTVLSIDGKCVIKADGLYPTLRHLHSYSTTVF